MDISYATIAGMATKEGKLSIEASCLDQHYHQRALLYKHYGNFWLRKS